MRRSTLLVLAAALCASSVAAAAPVPKNPAPKKRTVEGAVTAVSASSLTVGTLTCRLPAAVAAPALGTRVRIACRIDGGKLVLATLRRLTPPVEAVDPAPPVQAPQNGLQRDARGTLVGAGAGAITVDGADGRTLICGATPDQVAAAAPLVHADVLLVCRVDGGRYVTVSVTKLGA